MKLQAELVEVDERNLTERLDRIALIRIVFVFALSSVGGILAAALIFGAVRVNLHRQQSFVKVGLIASDTPENDDTANAGADSEHLLNAYAEQIAPLAAQGARVVVLPEKIVTVHNTDVASARILSVKPPQLASPLCSGSCILVQNGLVVVPHRTTLGCASTRSRNGVPTVGRRLAGLTSPWIAKYDDPILLQRRKIHSVYMCTRERNRRHGHPKKMVAGAVIYWNWKVSGAAS
jgi:hypothetical protein